jgi:hypothetical protein
MLSDWLHKLQLRLWQRRERAMARDLRPSGTSEGDWIGANVAASASCSGTGGQAWVPPASFNPSTCDVGSSGGGGDC